MQELLIATGSPPCLASKPIEGQRDHRGCSLYELRSIRTESDGPMQANGVQAYLTTLALFFLGWQLQLFSPSRVYDLFGEVLSAMNIFSLLFCAFLYFKVRQ